MSPLCVSARSSHWAAIGAVGFGSLMVLAWGFSATGHPPPLWFSRLVVLGTLVCVFSLAVGIGIEWLRGGNADRVLLALVVVALAVRFVGIDHEVEQRPYLDEGTYHHHATEINDGEVLRGRFAYPHFLYYTYAILFWLRELFPAVLDGGVQLFYGETESLAVDWVWMRAVVALLSSLCVVPVFRMAQAIGRTVAGLFAGAAFVASPLFNEISHLAISDAPSAVFATFSMWQVVRLFDRESNRTYALAGLFAGLAAATKYPAGVVAVGIFAAWSWCRLSSRRGRERGPRPGARSGTLGLAVATATAIGAFVAAMPGLLRYPWEAIWSGQGMFFGVRQYSGGGWLGVQPSSNAGWYLRELLASTGPMLLVAPLALLGVRRPEWRRLLWMLPFPTVYLALILSMNMVVKRNLLPVLPTLLVLVAVPLALALQAVLARANAARVGPPWAGRRQSMLVAAALVALLAVPAEKTFEQSVGLARPSTLTLARDWLRAHVAPGGAIVAESYTPKMPPEEYAVVRSRFLPRLGRKALTAEHADVVVSSSSAWQRFFSDDATEEHQVDARRLYEELFEAAGPRGKPLAVFAPTRFRRGPLLEVRSPLEPTGGAMAADESEAVALDEVFVPDGAMRVLNARGQTRAVRFFRPGQWVGLRAWLTPAKRSFHFIGVGVDGLNAPLDGDGPPPFSVEPVLRRTAGGGQAEVSVLGAGIDVVVPRAGFYILRITLPPESEITGVERTRRP